MEEYIPTEPPESTPATQWVFAELLRLQQIIIMLSETNADLVSRIEELQNGS